MVTICRKCKYSNLSPFYEARCNNPKIPYDDFIIGIRYCCNINKTGDCKFYEEAK